MYTGANNKKKPKNQISFIDFSYWYYKFNLLPIIGTMHPIILKLNSCKSTTYPLHIKAERVNVKGLRGNVKAKRVYVERLRGNVKDIC